MDGSMEKLHGDSTAGPRSKVWRTQRSKMEEVVPKRLIWDNPGGGESDSAKGVRRRCKKNSSSILSFIKRWLCPWQRSRDSSQQMKWDGPVPPRKPKESGRRGKY